MDRVISGRTKLFGEPQALDDDDPHTLAQDAFLANFQAQVIDVRGVSKGTRTGGIRRFSAAVVVGNGNVYPPLSSGTMPKAAMCPSQFASPGVWHAGQHRAASQATLVLLLPQAATSVLEPSQAAAAV